MFAADNWAIPYLRVGMQLPDAPDAAAKALALVSGGADYFSRCVTAAVPLNPNSSVSLKSRARLQELLVR